MNGSGLLAISYTKGLDSGGLAFCEVVSGIRAAGATAEKLPEGRSRTEQQNMREKAAAVRDRIGLRRVLNVVFIQYLLGFT